MKAFVFITVEPNKVDKVAFAVKQTEEVKEVYAVTGEFDILAKVEVTDFTTLSKIVKDKILAIEGVIHTSTSLAIEEY